MERSFNSTFEDHYKFKCLQVFDNKDVKQKVGRELSNMLLTIVEGDEIENMFVQKLGKDLRAKLVPKMVGVSKQDKELLSVKSEFHSIYNGGKKIAENYYPSDIYLKPHFLFFVKKFDPENSEECSKIEDYCKKIAAAENFKSYFVITLNLPEQYRSVSDNAPHIFHLDQDSEGNFQQPEGFKTTLQNMFLDMLVKKIADIPLM